jgi:hypothetical protein|tara:strand:- start:1771 stop:2034 length:264 start_codon:yes stop_codon:yes gene_type:complete
LTSRQLKEWELYYREEPFGEEYYQSGLICSIIANVNRDSKKQSEPFRPEDFIPRFTRSSKKEKMEYMKKQMTAMATKFVKREDKQSG